MWTGNGWPKFGDAIVNQFASMDNPRRTAYFVRRGERTGRMNRGKYFELTDGNGDVWTMEESSLRAMYPQFKCWKEAK